MTKNNPWELCLGLRRVEGDQPNIYANDELISVQNHQPKRVRLPFQSWRRHTNDSEIWCSSDSKKLGRTLLYNSSDHHHKKPLGDTQCSSIVWFTLQEMLRLNRWCDKDDDPPLLSTFPKANKEPRRFPWRGVGLKKMVEMNGWF